MIFGKIKSLLAVLALALLLAPAAQAAPAKLSSAWMGEHETFVAWYAKQQGWDKEAGLDLTMMPFDSGKNIVESLAAYDWAVAGCGAVPALTTPLSDYLYIIAVANDESANNAIYVRKDSPILGAKGTNPSYPNVYGSAVTVQKADILYPKSTSAHYLLATWLRILGLSEKDVKLQEMEPTPALSAFTGGVGENDWDVREWCLDGLEFMGVKLDKEKNNGRGEEKIITTPDSKVTAMVVLTNEELMIARETAQICGK